MFLKCDPYRVWCSIFYSKLVNCILLRSLFVFVKGRGTCSSGERNAKIWIDFRKSPRFSLTSPLSQKRKREVKSPCFYYVWWALNLQLPVQSVPITTTVVSFNPTHCKVYSIKHYVIKFVSGLRKICGFLPVHQFPPPIKLTAII
jgi:hypothetical protein